MHQIYIPDSTIAQARVKAQDMGALRGSIKRGGGNVYGFIGEIIVADLLGAKIENTFDYDLLLPDGTKLDVKTKSCTSAPKPEYACSVAAFNTKQQCDRYVFVRVKQDLSHAWVLGSIKKEQYFERAKFCKKGDADPDSKFGWTFKGDCYNLYIRDLQPIDLTPA